MKDITKKAVILNNFTSPYISEAIVILKNYDPRLEGKAIEEAEKLISDYIQKNHSKYSKKNLCETKEYVCKNKKKRTKNASSKPKLTFGIIFILLALVLTGIYNVILK